MFPSRTAAFGKGRGSEELLPKSSEGFAPAYEATFGGVVTVEGNRGARQGGRRARRVQTPRGLLVCDRKSHE